MAKYTLIDIVNKTLRSMSSDTVNTISDTVEATRVAEIVENVYYEMITNDTIEEHKEVVQATSLGDVLKPTYMEIPTSVTNIRLVQYDHADPAVTGEIDYRNMRFVPPHEFLRRTQGRDATDTATYQTVNDPSGVKLIIKKTEYPTYYTSFDDFTLIFDSFKQTDESTLQQSKTLILARKIPTFSMVDTATPDMDEALFPQLLNEVKSTAFVELKQTSNPKAEQKARQQKVRVQNDRSRHARSNGVPNYGRKR